MTPSYMAKLLLPETLLDIITNVTNRSNNQTQFLFSMLQHITLLIDLEEKIKNHHISYCPNDIEECLKILSLPESGKSGKWFNFTDRYAITLSKK